MIKFLTFIILATFAIIPNAQSAEPTLNDNHLLNFSGWHWRLNSYNNVLAVFNKRSPETYGEYDIGECSFCSGKEDGCEEDGIFEITLKKEPAIAVVCHIGAHSRQVKVFAPLKDNKNPVHTVTGAYTISYKETAEGIVINYDTQNKSGKFIQQKSYWPSMTEKND